MTMNRLRYYFNCLPTVLFILLTIPIQATAQPTDWGPMSPSLEDVPYPHPVSYMSFTMSGQDVRMAYMDVSPVGA